MRSVLAVCCFALVYSTGLIAVDLAAVFWLGEWDPKFVDQQGNVAFFVRWVLPFVSAVASISFAIGLAIQGRPLRLLHSRQVALSSGAAGGLAAALTLLQYVPRDLLVAYLVARILAPLAFLAGPACLAAVVFRGWALRDDAA